MYIYIFIYCYCYFIWWSTFILSRNLDKVFFTYNAMVIMSIRYGSIKDYMVLMRANNYFIYNYIRLLLNII